MTDEERFQRLESAIRAQTSLIEKQFDMIRQVDLRVRNLHMICSKLATLAAGAKTLPAPYTAEAISTAGKQLSAHQEEANAVFDLIIASLGGEDVAT